MPARGRPTEEREMQLAKAPLLTTLQRACAASRAAVSPSEEQNRRVAEDAFLRAAVAFEAFVSDWLPRCLHRDTSQLATTTRKAAQDEIHRRYKPQWPGDQDLFRPVQEAFELYLPSVTVEVEIPERVEIAIARRLLAVQDATRSLRDVADLKAFAGRCLARKYRERLTRLTASGEATLDAVIKIRNVLAHRSKRSVQEMNQALRNPALPMSLRVHQNVTAQTVGRYLRSARDDRPRYQHFFEAIAVVAHRLAPTRGRPSLICH